MNKKPEPPGEREVIYLTAILGGIFVLISAVVKYFLGS